LSLLLGYLLTYGAQKESSELLRLYEARTAIDALDEAIVEAKKRQVEGENNHKDEWKPDIDPRTAVRARVMPVLEKEQAELQKELSEVIIQVSLIRLLQSYHSIVGRTESQVYCQDPAEQGRIQGD
jgi:hypothetical protein